MLHREVTVSIEQSKGAVIIIATYLPLSRWRHFLPFLRLSGRVQRQLVKSRGIVKYGVAADLLYKRFWTVSIWTSLDAADAFVQAEPHATAIRLFPDWAAEGAKFVRWSSEEPRICWEEVIRRLESTTPRF